MIEMRKDCLIWMILALLCFTAVSCRKPSGFKRSSGFYYQYHVLNKDNAQPEVGDFVMVNMGLRIGDSVLSPMTQNNMLIDELYRGDIYSALRQMHLGDSATFIFGGKKFYEEFLGMGDYPYGKTPIYADIKLLKILSKKKIENAEDQFRAQRKRQRQREDSLIHAYANQYHLNTVHKGIYYTYTKRGNGAKAKKNKTVEILFRARRLDNIVFESRLDPSHPLSFTIGTGEMSRGIDIMVQEMNEGDQITVILPSSLVFGDNGSEVYNIPPFTPVVYDIELLKVLK